MEEHLLAKYQEENDRRQDVIHPSEMAKADWCPRATYYRIRDARLGLYTNTAEKFSGQRERIFQEGHDIHHKYQGYLRAMGVLWGKWTRLDKADTYVGLPPEKEMRPGQWRYDEVPLSSPRLLISGHADGGLPYRSGILEVKSIGTGTLRFENPTLLTKHTVEATTVTGVTKKIVDLDGLWRDIKRPLGSHLKQTFIYGVLATEMGLPFDKTIFIYENKATQAVKQFEVKFDPEAVDKQIGAALDIKAALDDSGHLPKRPRHTGTDTKICKACPFLKECYENEPTDDRETSAHEDGVEQPRRVRVVDDSGTSSAGAPERRRARVARRPYRPD
jgi:hypothetical protein